MGRNGDGRCDIDGVSDRAEHEADGGHARTAGQELTALRSPRIRPLATKTARTKRTTSEVDLRNSPRRTCVAKPPIMIIAKPADASAVSQGRTPVALGPTTPVAPRISSAPMRRTVPWEKPSTHGIDARRRSFGKASFTPPAPENTPASRRRAAHERPFIGALARLKWPVPPAVSPPRANSDGPGRCLALPAASSVRSVGARPRQSRARGSQYGARCYRPRGRRKRSSLP